MGRLGCGPADRLGHVFGRQLVNACVLDPVAHGVVGDGHVIELGRNAARLNVCEPDACSVRVEAHIADKSANGVFGRAVKRGAGCIEA